MRGKIVKGIAGFYYVHVPQKGVFECKAKGNFRNRSIKPLVGDNVEIDIIDAALNKGNITDVLKRKNKLLRPAVSNVDQVLVVFAASRPEPNLNLLDKFLMMMEYFGVETIVCFNKTDLGEEENFKEYKKMYESAGYRVLLTSVKEKAGVSMIKEILRYKTTVLAGPSGVGKSSMLNMLLDESIMETGDVSKKIGRGRHTTRHSEIFNIYKDTYIVDTPGFSSLFVEELDEKVIKNYFNEFKYYEGGCRFNGCMHIHEPGCAIKEAVQNGEIYQLRYENYVKLVNEYSERKKY